MMTREDVVKAYDDWEKGKRKAKLSEEIMKCETVEDIKDYLMFELFTRN